MDVKGTAFKARQLTIIQQFGQSRWDAFHEKLAKKEPFFAKTILTLTLIPAPTYLEFHRLLVEEFYGGDPRANWTLGEKGADWALREGPYRHFLASKNFAEFSESAAKLWSTYYNEGRASVQVAGSIIDVFIKDVPIHDVYFEYATLGFFKRGVELTGVRVPSCTCVRGFSKGQPDVHYRMAVE